MKLPRLSRRHSYRSAEGRKHPDAYSADELHQFLVSDAVKLHATDLAWAVAAYARIAELQRIPAEEAYQRVVGEVEELTGRRYMPMASFG